MATANKLTVIPCGAMTADLTWLLLKPGVSIKPPSEKNAPIDWVDVPTHCVLVETDEGKLLWDTSCPSDWETRWKETGLQEFFPYDKVIGVFAVVLVPVAVGMLARRFAHPLARALDRPVRLLSVVVLILAIALSLVSERERVVAHLPTVGLAALAFNLISLSVGYAAPRLFGLSKRQAIAVGMKVGIHNGTLAIAVATGALGSIIMAMPAAIYSLLMFVTAAIYTVLVNRGRGEP